MMKSIMLISTKESLKPAIDDELLRMIRRHMNVLDLLDYFVFTAESPKEYAGKKIMIFHGSKDNTIAPASRIGLETHADTDFIFCCHPKATKRVLNDQRIQWNIDGRILVGFKEIGNNTILVTIQEEVE